MKSIIITSLAVLPTLAYGLTTPGIENVPAAPHLLPHEDDPMEYDEALAPTVNQFHETSTEDTLTEITEPTDEETYPRPSLSWLSDLPRPELGSVPYGEVLTSCTKPNTIALTFDDGPWKYTSDLLDLLEEAGARATFFVCGSNMDDRQLTRHGYPSLLRRMVTEGHQVGSHTWGHANLAKLDEEDITSQLLDNEQALVQDLGFIPTYLRPPYFSSNEEALDVVGELGYHVVDAGIDTRDWTGDYDAARENFDEAIREDRWGEKGKIVLAHDIKERTAHELAEYMIEQADEHGYQLVTVGECLGDPPRNWYRSPSTGESWLSRSHGSDGGRDNDLEERAVMPPPDALKGYKSSVPVATTVSRHRLHIHTLAPPTPTEHHGTLVQRAEEAPTSISTQTVPGSPSGFCPYIKFEDFGPRWEWCCDMGYHYCPWRTTDVAQEAETANSYMLMDVMHQPTLTLPGTTTIAAPDLTIHTITLGHMCKSPNDKCTPVFRTVTRIIDYGDERPTATTTRTSASPTDDSISVHTIILGYMCEIPYDGCTPVYKTVTRIADHADGRPTATTTGHPEGPAGIIRAMPMTTTMSDLPFKKLPPIGSNMPSDWVKARAFEFEGPSSKRDELYTVASSDMMDEIPVILDGDTDDSSKVLVDDMDDRPHVERRLERESQVERQEADEGQSLHEHQHQQEKELEHERGPTVNATTSHEDVPVAAGAVHASTAKLGMVLVLANLFVLFGRTGWLELFV